MSAGMAEVIRQELRKGGYQMPGDTQPYETQAANIAEELAKAGYGNVQEALITAANEMEQERATWCLDESGRHWISRTLNDLRQRAHANDPESRVLVQAIHSRKAQA